MLKPQKHQPLTSFWVYNEQVYDIDKLKWKQASDPSVQAHEQKLYDLIKAKSLRYHFSKLKILGSSQLPKFSAIKIQNIKAKIHILIHKTKLNQSILKVISAGIF